MNCSAIDCRIASAAGRGLTATLRLGFLAGASAITIASLALANPQGGEVVSGQATISAPSATQTTITQSSDKAIIDWKSFNIGANESTTFVQPNSNSVALNRIFDNDPSIIAGLLSANGKLILINRNGLLFDSGAVINAAGLVATTSDIGDDDFMAGRMNFSTPGAANAQITNKGMITADEGGMIAFVAPSVRNSGVITAKLGRVALGSGDTFTLDLYGDNLISFPISAEIARELVDADGNPITSLLDVSGKIDAGSVQLTARAARGIVNTVINVDGEVVASGIKQAGSTTQLTGAAPSGGRYGQAIVIDGGANGVVNVSGKLDASSATAAGGNVGITGELIMLDGANIDASGRTGGGTIAVGYSGEGAARVVGADRIIVKPSTVLRADAIESGNGGRIVFWSNLATDFYGEMSARGGALSGDGGLLEISSKDQVGFAGLADASAANGAVGQLSLDPKNITISIFGGTGGVANPNQLTFANQSTSSLTITPNFLTTTLNTGTAVTLQANNDITVGLFSAITVNNPGGNGGALTLQAGRSVIINSSITTDNGNLTIVANELLANGVVNAQRDAGAAELTMASGTSINAGTGAVNLTIASGAGKSQLASGDITLRSITAGTIKAENLGTTAGSDVIIASGTLAASGAGTPLVLASQGGTFTNNSGAGALSTPAGRWLVYTNTPAATNENGLAGTPFYNTIYNPANPTGISATGNKFAYSLAANLTVTPNNASREYGAANPAFTYGITGLLGTDTLAAAVQGAPTISTLANATSSVAGGPYAITAALGTLASAYNYGFTFAPGQLAITPATLTYLATPTSRLYGDANPALTGTVTGFKGTDTLGGSTTGALTFTSPALVTSNVGSYAINGSGLTANGGNYVFVQALGNATALTINPATLTYLANPVSRLYGDANPALSGTISGFKNGQTQGTATTGAMTFTTAATAASNVGGYAINGAGLTAINGNYVFAQSASNATALTINPATLTYTANAASRLYGDANPAFSGSVAGFKNGQTQATATTGAMTFTSPALTTSNVGSYAINGSGLVANNGNYIFAQAAANATALTINPATLTYLADSQSRLYGDANPALTGTVTGFKGTDTIANATGGALTFTSPALLTSNVGTYAINGSGLTANNGNYLFTQAAANATALTINPATLTYTATAASRLYGDANPAFTGTVDGFKNGQTIASATTGSLTFSSPALVTDNVGSYAINGAGLAANNGNYVFAQAAGNATALTINPATLLYTANTASRLYGDANPAFSGTVSGFKNGQTQATATTGSVTFTSPALATSNAGSYAINGSGLTSNSGNYVFAQAAGNATALTINPAQLFYKADAKSRSYGDPNGVLTGIVTGLKNGDAAGAVTSGTLTFTGTGNEFSNVGTYAINGSGLTVSSGNYLAAIGQDPSNATALQITPAQLYYLASPRNSIYGEADSNVDGDVIGLKNGDDVGDIATGNAFFTTSVVANTSVGQYAITGQGLTVFGPNYMPTILQDPSNATAYTITQAQLFYVADSDGREYGDPNGVFGGGIDGIIDGDTLESVVSGTLVFSTAATQLSNVGLYDIIGSGLTVINPNYALTILQDVGNTGAYQITPAQLTYVSNEASREYGDANPLFSGTVDGLKNGDLLTSVTSGTLTFVTSAGLTTPVGNYEINGTGLTVTSGNYVATIVQDSGNSTQLQIVPAQLYYAANTMSSIYGDDVPPASGTVQGLKNGESLTSVTIGTLVWTAFAGSGNDVGVYSVLGSGLAAFNPNYEVQILQRPENQFAQIINPAQLTYVADPKKRSAQLPDPPFTGHVAGLKNNDVLDDVTFGTLVFTTDAPADTLGGTYGIFGGGLTLVSGNYLATILQDPSNATAFTVIPIPSTSPQAHQEVLENEDGIGETVEDSVASRSNDLNILGTNIVSDDMSDGTNDEMAGQLCVLGAPEAAKSKSCDLNKELGN